MKNEEKQLRAEKMNNRKTVAWVRILVLPAIALLFFFLQSCKNEKGPDVSGIRIDLKTLRFEKDFFSLDTSNVMASLGAMNNKYPHFLRDYCEHILGLPPLNDTSAQAISAVKR
ncbi:MAG: hypothetical protein ABI687_04960, partial [Flavitalea sp.]